MNHQCYQCVLNWDSVQLSVTLIIAYIFLSINYWNASINKMSKNDFFQLLFITTAIHPLVTPQGHFHHQPALIWPRQAKINEQMKPPVKSLAGELTQLREENQIGQREPEEQKPLCTDFFEDEEEDISPELENYPRWYREYLATNDGNYAPDLSELAVGGFSRKKRRKNFGGNSRNLSRKSEANQRLLPIAVLDNLIEQATARAEENARRLPVEEIHRKGAEKKKGDEHHSYSEDDTLSGIVTGTEELSLQRQHEVE